MTKLSNVVGGLLRDLAQSHTISDAFTVELVDTYRREPTLSQLPLPRMSIRSAQLTLRFAVAAVQDEVSGPDPAELRDLWLRTVRERLVPRTLRFAGRLDNARVVAAFERQLAAADVTGAVDPTALLDDDREGELVEATTEFLARVAESLPASVRRSLEGTDLKDAIARVARAEVPQLRAAARRLEQARRASEAELDVSVTTEALGAVPEASISELVLTVDMEEVLSGRAPDAGGTGG